VQLPEPTSSCPSRIDTKNIEEMAPTSIHTGASHMPGALSSIPGASGRQNLSTTP
jgi:hypothetical protein